MQIDDNNIRIIADYIKQDPSLEFIILNKNSFTDIGMIHICEALRNNTRLLHIYIMDCQHLTDLSITELLDVI